MPRAFNGRDVVVQPHGALEGFVPFVGHCSTTVRELGATYRPIGVLRRALADLARASELRATTTEPASPDGVIVVAVGAVIPGRKRNRPGP
jgi:hypothetical protein